MNKDNSGYNSFAKNNFGVAALEMAIILPFLLAIIMGVVEFGLYFTKSSIVERAVNNTSNAIQLNPASPNLQNDANSSGLGVLNFTAPNFFCAKSYTTHAAAASGLCTSGEWKTTAPATGYIAGTPYYVAIKSSVTYSSLTPFGKFLHDIVVKNVVQISQSATQSHGIFKAGYSSISSTSYPTYTVNPTLPPISGSWTVPAGVSSIKVTLVSGGQGGNGNGAGGGIGGISGNVLVAYISNLSPSQSLPYTVGNGGAGAINLSGSGVYGGQTKFNGLSASGKDNYSTSATYGTVTSYATFDATPGAYQKNYEWNTPVSGCAWCRSSALVGGQGGDTPLGFGQGGETNAAGTMLPNRGADGRGYGAGGSGAYSTKLYPSTSYLHTIRGGNGAAGLLIIEW